jgi:hypothetical protein
LGSRGPVGLAAACGGDPRARKKGPEARGSGAFCGSRAALGAELRVAPAGAGYSPGFLVLILKGM